MSGWFDGKSQGSVGCDKRCQHPAGSKKHVSRRHHDFISPSKWLRVSWIHATSQYPAFIVREMASAPIEKDSSNVPLLQDLGDRIATDATTVSQYLQEGGLPLPSFQPGAPPMVLPVPSPVVVQEARQRLISAALELFHLASGPGEFLPHLITNVRENKTISHTCASG